MVEIQSVFQTAPELVPVFALSATGVRCTQTGHVDVNDIGRSRSPHAGRVALADRRIGWVQDRSEPVPSEPTVKIPGIGYSNIYREHRTGAQCRRRCCRSLRQYPPGHRWWPRSLSRSRRKERSD